MSNSLDDEVGGANLYGGNSYSFTTDRFCSPNSAIYLNQGYLQVPAGVYFSGDFTVTAWIYLKSYQLNSRIFDFGNGQDSDNVILAMLSTQICGQTLQGSNSKTITSSRIIDLNQWYFVSYVLDGTTAYIYVNGNQFVTGQLYIPNNVVRTSNYIGKCNWNGYPNADAIYDEIKIYQVALSPVDIINMYQNSSNYGKILNLFII